MAFDLLNILSFAATYSKMSSKFGSTDFPYVSLQELLKAAVHTKQQQGTNSQEPLQVGMIFSEFA